MKKKQIAVEEKRREDGFEWAMGNVQGVCKKEIEARERVISALDERIAAIKARTKETKGQMRGQKVVIKGMIGEAKKEIEECAGFAWELERSVKEGDWAMAKKLLRENGE